jgi:hypothetical protein
MGCYYDLRTRTDKLRKGARQAFAIVIVEQFLGIIKHQELEAAADIENVLPERDKETHQAGPEADELAMCWAGAAATFEPTRMFSVPFESIVVSTRACPQEL